MAQRRGPRPLSAEDREMWRRVTQTVRATKPEPADPPPQPQPKPASKRPKKPGPAPPKPPEPAKKPDPISAAQLDGKLESRLRRGRLEPERTLDLHGLSAARAEAILKIFIEQSRADGLRLVLVITGKGRSARPDEGIMPQRRGVLRDHLPVWLGQMGNAVVKSAAAHPRHGGGGAFYVYLRRKRGGPGPAPWPAR